MGTFDINDYGALWNPDWKLSGAGRGLGGATYLRGDVLVTSPRDTRPCLLEREVALGAGSPRLLLEVGAAAEHSWRLQVFVDDDKALEKTIDGEGESSWTRVEADLSKYAGQTVVVRLYQWMPSETPVAAYWRKAAIE